MAQSFVDADGNFSMPMMVADLNDVPDEWREVYRLIESGRDAGKYSLSPKARQLRDWYAREAQRVHDEGQSGLAAQQSELEALQRQNHEEAVSAALKSELLAQGAKSELVKGATALLRQQFQFEVEPGYGDERVVICRNDFGLTSVQGAVRGLLESDEGAAFRNRSAAPSESYFTSMLSGLRARR
jgi:hypothetical protein